MGGGGIEPGITGDEAGTVEEMIGVVVIVPVRQTRQDSYDVLTVTCLASVGHDQELHDDVIHVPGSGS